MMDASENPEQISPTRALTNRRHLSNFEQWIIE
jgi:hypothetical protein